MLYACKCYKCTVRSLFSHAGVSEDIKESVAILTLELYSSQVDHYTVNSHKS